MLLIVGALLIVLRIASVVSRRQWAVLSSGLLAADLVSFSHAYLPFNGVRTIFPETPTFNFLSSQPQPFRMVAVNDANGANMETFYGLSSAGGYDFMLKEPVAITAGLIKIRYDSITFMAQGIVATSNRILDLFNVEYVLASRSNESRDLLGTQPTRFREIWSDRAVTIFENRNELPRAFFVPQSNIEVISSKEAQLHRLLETSFDPQSTVILQVA